MKKIFVIAVAGLLVGSMNVAYAGKKNTCCKVPVKAGAAKTIPDVTYPFTFKCQHCGMTITIKSKDEWTQSCGSCACGSKNIDCYKPAKK